MNIHGRINAILELGSSLKPEMTGRENIKLNLQINQIDKDREQITKEIIEFADIGEHIDQPIKSYSSGMKARLGFGIATSTDPDILIVDEVLAVGDVLFRRKCYSKIEKLFKDGKTVIFVSHSAQSVVEFCSRAILLYDREIIMDGMPKKITNYYQKLVFSKDKKSVLDEINGKISIEEKVPSKKIKKIEENREFYLPDFKSIPEIHNFGHDVHFSDFNIYNSENKLINILSYGEEYTFSFKAELNIAGEVSFGSQIVNAKGLVLSGATTAKRKQNYQIQKGDTILINYHFKCFLSAGTYFFNSSSSIYQDNQYKPLAKALNSFVFKVKRNTNSFIGKGFVDLGQRIRVEYIKN